MSFYLGLKAPEAGGALPPGRCPLALPGLHERWSEAPRLSEPPATSTPRGSGRTEGRLRNAAVPRSEACRASVPPSSTRCCGCTKGGIHLSDCRRHRRAPIHQHHPPRECQRLFLVPKITLRLLFKEHLSPAAWGRCRLGAGLSLRCLSLPEARLFSSFQPPCPVALEAPNKTKTFPSLEKMGCNASRAQYGCVRACVLLPPEFPAAPLPSALSRARVLYCIRNICSGSLLYLRGELWLRASPAPLAPCSQAPPGAGGGHDTLGQGGCAAGANPHLQPRERWARLFKAGCDNPPTPLLCKMRMLWGGDAAGPGPRAGVFIPAQEAPGAG